MDDTYGMNIRSLKDKTVSRPGPVVKNNIEGLPSWVSEQHRAVVLCADIMFVNKIISGINGMQHQVWDSQESKELTN